MGKILQLFKNEVDTASRLKFEAALDRCTKIAKQSTRDTSISAVKHWIKLFEYPENPKRINVLNYIQHSRVNLNHCNKTIKKCLCVLRQVYKELNSEDVFTEQIKKIKTSVKRPERRKLSLVEFDRVIELVESPSAKTIISQRDVCMMALWAGGGLRITESLKLRLCDIEVHSDKIVVELIDPKAGIPQQQVISSQFTDYILRYFKIRLSESPNLNSPLITTYDRKSNKATNKAQTRRNATRSFYGYAKLCKMKNVSPHSLRASAITRLLSTHKDPRLAQEFARHSDMTTTLIYDRRHFSVENSPANLLKF